MSLINFMNSNYISKIECDKPQRDDFRVENLIHDNNKSNLRM